MKIAPLAIDGVSSQNIYDCARLLLSPAPISRNEAAERLGLSSVTVGKVAAAMLDGGLLSAEKRKGAKGRSAELYRAPDPFAVLLILLGKQNFSAYVSNRSSGNRSGSVGWLHVPQENDSCVIRIH